MEQGTRYIGRSVRSKEAPRHVTGRGRYVDDLALPRMLHACMLRSPYAHARIVAVDATGAAGLPGVKAVITPDEVKRLSRPFKPGRYAAGLRVPIPEYAGAIGKVRYVGEPVAIVAAESRARAEDALELIDVQYDALPAVVTTADAVAPSAPVLYEELGSNVAWQGHVSYGDVDAAFARADRIVRANLKIHRYSSTPLEPFACLAEATPERLTIWCNSQSPDVIYEALSEALGIDAVRVIVPDVGGGFGQKIHLIRKYAVLTALMAVKTGRPVKWIEDRSEHMMAGGHSCEQEFDVEAAVTADGEVLGLTIRDTDDVGGSVSTLTIHFTNKLNNLFNTYKVQHLRLEGRSVLTNKCPVVPNRGIGKPGMCFVWERTMDRVARELGLDPIEVRRRNLVPKEQFPYTTPNGNIHGSGDYQALLDRVLANVGYDEVRRRQQEQREAVARTLSGSRGAPDRARPTTTLLGIGVVIGIEPGGRNAARDMAIFPQSTQMPGAGGVEGATVKIEKNGSVVFTLGSPSCGQSHETTAAQIIADVLGVAPERVSAAGTFDTALSPWGISSSNSGNNFHLYDVGAVHGAAARLRDKVLTLAAHVLKADRESLRIEDGVVYGPAEMTFAELGKIAYGNQALLPPGFEPGLQATYYYSHPHADPLMLPDMQGRVRAQYTFSSAAHAAVVEVDTETGRVRVVRYAIVSDNGTLINPSVVDGQIYGSAAHGISVALGEGFVYDADGQLLTLTLLDYGKSTTLETPRIEVEHYPVPDPFTTLGQKAAGEGAAIPSPAAIASAVEDALAPFGVEVRRLPLSPERVWELINGGDSVGRALSGAPGRT
ncbi:MAG: xanthine dehydrogenase family protein molybdopterin-binding subunit [Acidobacteria bacterium]|nr:xanthine dehydrogenase family protein molybdopterin-binding subunit [Acidobacteriota bacterium]